MHVTRLIVTGCSFEQQPVSCGFRSCPEQCVGVCLCPIQVKNLPKTMKDR